MRQLAVFQKNSSTFLDIPEIDLTVDAVGKPMKTAGSGRSLNVVKSRTASIADDMMNQNSLNMFFSDQGRGQGLAADFDSDEEGPNSSTLKGKLQKDKAGSKNGSTKSKKVPWSFEKTKTAKEIALEQKHRFEMKKLEKKAEARMQLAHFIEEKKAKRHVERCVLMSDLLKKM